MNRYISRRTILIGIIVLMALASMANGRFSSPGEWFINTLLMLPGIIVGLSFHEFAHALAAVRSGDPTPKNMGRLTINPAAHVDPIGMVCLLFAGFGWGVPVQVNSRNFKHPKRDELLVCAAGVIMNFILAFAFVGIAKLFVTYGGAVVNGELGDIIIKGLMYTVQINLVLLVFNLIPVPPLDGFGIVTELFNLRNTKFFYMAYQYGFLILLLLIAFDITDMILSPLVAVLYNFLLGIFF